jgi:hypothetical protein
MLLVLVLCFCVAVIEAHHLSNRGDHSDSEDIWSGRNRHGDRHRQQGNHDRHRERSSNEDQGRKHENRGNHKHEHHNRTNSHGTFDEANNDQADIDTRANGGSAENDMTNQRNNSHHSGNESSIRTDKNEMRPRFGGRNNSGGRDAEDQTGRGESRRGHRNQHGDGSRGGRRNRDHRFNQDEEFDQERERGNGQGKSKRQHGNNRGGRYRNGESNSHEKRGQQNRNHGVGMGFDENSSSFENGNSESNSIESSSSIESTEDVDDITSTTVKLNVGSFLDFFKELIPFFRRHFKIGDKHAQYRKRLATCDEVLPMQNLNITKVTLFF